MSEQEPFPSNPLEQSLLNAKHDQRFMGDFFNELLKSQVYVLVAKPAAQDNALDSSGDVCVLTNKSGNSVVPVFTTRDKASPWHERQPRFQYGLLVSAASLISGLGSEVGLVLNAGHPIGVEIPAKVIATLRQQASANLSVT